MGFVAHFILLLPVQEFWRSVKFWPSYSKLSLAHFWGHSVFTYWLSLLTDISRQQDQHRAETLKYHKNQSTIWGLREQCRNLLLNKRAIINQCTVQIMPTNGQQCSAHLSVIKHITLKHITCNECTHEHVLGVDIWKVNLTVIHKGKLCANVLYEQAPSNSMADMGHKFKQE